MNLLQAAGLFYGHDLWTRTAAICIGGSGWIANIGWDYRELNNEPCGVASSANALRFQCLSMPHFTMHGWCPEFNHIFSPRFQSGITCITPCSTVSVPRRGVKALLKMFVWRPAFMLHGCLLVMCTLLRLHRVCALDRIQATTYRPYDLYNDLTLLLHAYRQWCAHVCSCCTR